MSFIRFVLFTVIALFATLNLQKTEVNGGPLSLSFARSFRSGREIRAPFKTSDIMVARGFGKRNSAAAATATKINAAEENDSNEKRTNVGGNSLITNENYDAYGYGPISKIDYLASELATNPYLARWILHRFVDSNGNNGRIITQEPYIPYTLENFEYY